MSDFTIPLNLEYNTDSCMVRDDHNLPFVAIRCALPKGHEQTFHCGKHGKAFFVWPVNKNIKRIKDAISS